MYAGWARHVDAQGKPGVDYWTYFANRLVQNAGLQDRIKAGLPGDWKILDIGTDDGNVLFKAIEALGSRASGVGIDVYAGDFQVGLDEARRNSWKDRIDFVQMDANDLGLASQKFDCVLANFVGWDDTFDFEKLQFLQDEKRSAEIWRVLKPGGQVGIGAWVEQTDIDWLDRQFKEFIPAVEAAGSKQPICYARENPAGYRLILQRSGFVDVQEVVETDSFACPERESWWKQMERATRECFELVQDPLALQLFKEQVLYNLQPFLSPAGIQFSKTVCYVYGRKPGPSQTPDEEIQLQPHY